MRSFLLHFSISLTLILVMLLGYHQIFTQPKIGWVNGKKVFEEFKLKKILEAEFRNAENSKKNQLDSIRLVIETYQGRSKKDPKLVNILEQNLATELDNYAVASKELANNINQQIWNQLNQYAIEFGKKNNYTIIINSVDQNSVLYGSNTTDITDQFVTYANKKFHAE